ncbi:MAG: hypothetical protein AB7G11_01035 [Phycisphaerales bacterium]
MSKKKPASRARATSSKVSVRAAASPPRPPGRSAEIVLDIEFDADSAYIILANCGDAAATDISVRFSRALVGLGGSMNLSELPVFRSLGVLRPGQSIRIFWDAASTIFAAGQAARFAATVTWGEAAGASRSATYHHDPAVFRALPRRVHPAPG